MEVLQENGGQRTIAVTLYNAAAATLAGNKDRTVKLAFFSDDLLEKDAPVATSGNQEGVTLADNTFTITGEDNLRRIDAGTFTLVFTYNVGTYVQNTLKESEIPDSGVYLYADAWTEGKVGEQTESQRLPEPHSADNQAAALFTEAYARTGHQYTSLDVEQGTDGSGNTTAAVTMTNNSLQAQEGGRLLAVLLDDKGETLESQVVDVSGTLSGETSRTQEVSFTQEGQRVLVYPLTVDEKLCFEGLPILAEDFRPGEDEDEFAYTYRLRDADGSSSTLVITAYSGDGVEIDGENFTLGGAKSISLAGLIGEGTSGKTL